MKQLNKLLLTLLMSGAGTAGAFADPYVCNFDTPIPVNFHDFKVASNWRHIVDVYEYEDYGDIERYYMSYSYTSNEGVDGTGGLKSYSQTLGPSGSYSKTGYDLLVTPKVAGDITLDVKNWYNGNAFVEVYEYDEAKGTKGAQIGTRFSGLAEIPTDGFNTLHLIPEDKRWEEPKRICLRIQYVLADNFTAGNAEIEVEKSMIISKITPIVDDPTSGTITWKQAEDLTVPISFKVIVTNNGDADLTTGEENYTITIRNDKNDMVSDPIPVPVNLAVGETSEEFIITYTIPADKVSSFFINSYTYPKFELVENLGGSSIVSTQGRLQAYESKFIFCLPTASEYNSSSLTAAQEWGIITEPVYKEYELRGNAPAPYEVISMELPEGFSFEEELTLPLTISDGDKIPVKIGLTENGSHSGQLKITYKNYGKENTEEYTLSLSGSKIAEGTWNADFNGPTSGSPIYPLGSYAETGISGGYNGSSNGIYNNYLSCTTSNNTKFYTPLLHANANDTFSFDVKNYSYQYPLKVYVTTDRNNIGEPVFEMAGSEFNNTSTFYTKTITFEEEGDYYIVFDIAGKYLDNLVGLTKVDVAHDIIIKEFKLDSEVQNGKTIKPSLEFYPMTNEEASDYTAKFYLGDQVVSTIESVDLLHSAKTSKKFEFSYTTEVEETTETTGYIALEFTDGTILKTDVLPIKITNEPYFAFGEKSNSSLSATAYWAPSSTTTAIAFGTTNKTDLSKAYKIVNWGTAPFTVSSITVPEGFAVDFTEGTIAGKTEQEVNVTFPTTIAGTYNGELVIAYNDGEEKEFKLAISGTMLDPTKWYADFNGAGGWPEGSIHQEDVTLYSGYTTPCIQSTYSTSSKQRMFITPLMKAEAGEQMSFSVLNGSTYNTEAFLKVYAAKKRSDLYAADAEGNYGDAILLATFTPDNEDEDLNITKEWKRVAVTLPEAGDYYIGFEFCRYIRVDDISGLTPIIPENDLEFASATIPATGTQNTIATGDIKVYNYLNTLEAGSYTVKSYVDGVLSMEAEGEVALTANQKYKGTINTIPVEFRSPKVGTYPVYFEFICGETVLKSEPVEVTFGEEVLENDKTTGESAGTDTGMLNLYYKDFEFISLYNQADLGLNAGDKINSIIVKGFGKRSYTTTAKIYYGWVDDTSLANPGYKTGYVIPESYNLTELVNGEYTWPYNTNGSTNLMDMISINFDEPLSYENGKSFFLFVSSSNSSYASSGDFALEVSGRNTNTWKHSDDGTAFEFNSDWTSNKAPLLYISLAAEPTQISGVVSDSEDNTVADAVVTLVSTDGDNIQYTGTTDENGAYAINVIQSGREYDVEVKTADKAEFENGVSFADGSVTLDFSLLDILMISDEGDNTNLPANAVMYVEKSLNPGFNAVAFPITLSKEEVEEIFGEDVVVLEFDAVTTDAAAAVVNFSEVVDKTMEAGKPYLIFADQESKEVKFRTKGAPSALKTTSTETNDFLATDKRMAMEEGMFVLTNGNFEGKKNARTRAAVELPAYSGYIKAPNATSLTFTTDVNIETSIEEAEVVKVGNDVIYDLNGVRVKNPAKGIYIINGKPVMVK